MKLVCVIMVLTLSTQCMKRTIPLNQSNPEKKPNKNISLEIVSSPHQRQIVFDSFMIVQQFDQVVSQEERDSIQNNFVRSGIVENNTIGLLLQQYHKIIMTEARTPQKKINENNEIFFE